MHNASRLLVPALLAGLLPVSDLGVANATTAASDGGPACDTPSLDVSDAATGHTYGELLLDLARKSANRAATKGHADPTMEAISELAVRWLRMPEGATRVWDRKARTEQSADMAVRNAQRSQWRKQRRHQRLAQIASKNEANMVITPNQQATVEVKELLDSMPDAERQLLLYSAHGMNSTEIAAKLGISSAAVRQRLARARRALR